jgi:hypothetical protein
LSEKFSSSMPLVEVTVQDIQLELIRRSRFNAFDGERVVASLLARRHLWQAVLLDRPGFTHEGRLPAAGLIKLRDLRYNIWNADTLYVLTPDEASARELAALCEAEDWGGEVWVHTDREDVDRALGSGRTKQVVLTVWWD